MMANPMKRHGETGLSARQPDALQQIKCAIAHLCSHLATDRVNCKCLSTTGSVTTINTRRAVFVDDGHFGGFPIPAFNRRVHSISHKEEGKEKSLTFVCALRAIVYSSGWSDGWRIPEQAARIGPNMLLMQLEHARSCIYLGVEHEEIFPELHADADAFGECAVSCPGDDAKIDIALLPASASFPAVPGVPDAAGDVFGSQRAIGANSTCVTYAVKPGVVRVVCVLDQGAQQSAPLCRVRGPSTHLPFCSCFPCVVFVVPAIRGEWIITYSLAAMFSFWIFLAVCCHTSVSLW